MRTHQRALLRKRGKLGDPVRRCGLWRAATDPVLVCARYDDIVLCGAEIRLGGGFRAKKLFIALTRGYISCPRATDARAVDDSTRNSSRADSETLRMCRRGGAALTT